MYANMYVDVYSYVNIDTYTNAYNHTLIDEYVCRAVYDYARRCVSEHYAFAVFVSVANL